MLSCSSISYISTSLGKSKSVLYFCSGRYLCAGFITYRGLREDVSITKAFWMESFLVRQELTETYFVEGCVSSPFRGTDSKMRVVSMQTSEDSARSGKKLRAVIWVISILTKYFL